MSSGGMTREEAWAIQLAYHKTAGTTPPTEMHAEDEAIFRELLGDAAVDEIRAREAAAAKKDERV